MNVAVLSDIRIDLKACRQERNDMGHSANRTPIPATGNGKTLGLAVHWLRLVQ